MSAKGEKWYFMPFLYDDWLGSEQVRLMPLDARGLFIDLLACQWKNGSIPSDVSELWRLIGTREEDIRSAWPKVAPLFDEVQGLPGRVQNARLEQIRADQKAYQQVRTEAAVKANEIRWQREREKAALSAESERSPIGSKTESKADPRKEKKRKEKNISPTETAPIDPATVPGPYGIALRVIGSARQALGLEPPIDADIKRELRKASPLQKLVELFGEERASSMFAWAYTNWESGCGWSAVLNQRDRIIAAMDGTQAQKPSPMVSDFSKMLAGMRRVTGANE